MKSFSPHTSDNSFRARVFGKPEIPIVVRLFGLYLAVLVPGLIGAGVALGLKLHSGATLWPSNLWLLYSGCLLAPVCAIVLFQTGRALQTGRRWAVWATLVLSLLAGVTAIQFFILRYWSSDHEGTIAFFGMALPALVAFIVAFRNRSVFTPLDAVTARRVNLAFKWGIPSAILLLAVGSVGLNVAAARYEHSVNARWAALGLNPENLPNRFPRAEANETARMLANLVATDECYKRIGSIDSSRLLDPRSPYAGRFGLVDHYQPPFMNRWAISEDLQSESGDNIGELPADVTNYLDKHRADFALMYQAIRNQPPQWEMDISRGANAPTPHFWEGQTVVYLICLDVLNDLRQGRKAEALAGLECAWIVSRSYSARPEINSQLIATRCDRTIALTLRKVNGVTPEWHARLADRDWLNRFRLSIACEAYAVAVDAKKYGVRGFNAEFKENARLPFWERWLFGLSRPLARYWAAEVSEGYLLGLERAEQADVCGAEQNPFQELHSRTNLAYRLPSRARLPVTGSIPLDYCWRNEIRRRYTLEMTDKLLTVKEAASNGRLTQESFGFESSICPDAQWMYETTPGAFTLTFSRKSEFFGKDNAGDWQGLFRVEWPWSSGQRPVARNQ